MRREREGGIAVIEHGEPIDGERTVAVVLVGGPADLPEALRSIRVSAARAAQKIKVAHRSGYGHFEPSAGHGGGDQGPVVLRWAGLTKIAK